MAEASQHRPPAMITGTLPSGEQVRLWIAVADDHIELCSSHGWAYQLDLEQAADFIDRLAEKIERLAEARRS